MGTKNKEFLVDTDVIEDYLITRSEGPDSYLEFLMKTGICFTTVLNASEILHKAASIEEEKIIIDVLSAFKVLGLHSRYSLRISKYSKIIMDLNRALFCVVADYNKLPIVTLEKSKFTGTGLQVYNVSEIMK